jgi:hypothetical protein
LYGASDPKRVSSLNSSCSQLVSARVNIPNTDQLLIYLILGINIRNNNVLFP